MDTVSRVVAFQFDSYQQLGGRVLTDAGAEAFYNVYKRSKIQKDFWKMKKEYRHILAQAQHIKKSKGPSFVWNNVRKGEEGKGFYAVWKITE